MSDLDRYIEERDSRSPGFKNKVFSAAERQAWRKSLIEKAAQYSNPKMIFNILPRDEQGISLEHDLTVKRRGQPLNRMKNFEQDLTILAADLLEND